MDSRPIRILVCALALGCLLAAPPAAPAASVKKQVKSLKKQLKSLKKQVKKLKVEFGDFSAKPGPPGPRGLQGLQGAQGVQGAAPACQGNNATDKMVKAGSVCIDRYEDSIWTARTGGTRITGAIPCDPNGQDCKGKIFARSVAGVTPRADITWFQAQQALANVGKRLPSNAEWQQAVAGTPDSSFCRVSGHSAVATGSMANCISDWGANDMVGNLWEWVADWVPLSTTCHNWGNVVTFSSDDLMCLSGASTSGTAPGALDRGGSSFNDTDAGPFAVDATVRPSDSVDAFGFRGAR